MVLSPETVESQSFWTALRGDALPAWLRVYRESVSSPSRDTLISALATLAPFETVLEVGCHCGPNLHRLWPAVGPFEYVGLDVNGAALSAARRDATEAGLADHARWFLGSIVTDSKEWPSQSFDLVFSSSCLAHIGPLDVHHAAAEMMRLSSRVVVWQEQQETKAHGAFHQWAHDYAALIRAVPSASCFRWTQPSDHLWVGVRS